MAKQMSLGSELTHDVTNVTEELLLIHAIAAIQAHDMLVDADKQPLFSFKEIIREDPLLAEREDTMAVTLMCAFGRQATPPLARLLAKLHGGDPNGISPAVNRQYERLMHIMESKTPKRSNS